MHQNCLLLLPAVCALHEQEHTLCVALIKITFGATTWSKVQILWVKTKGVFKFIFQQVKVLSRKGNALKRSKSQVGFG